MTIEKGITEVADSDDEPMTSSPTPVSDEAAQDKLCAMAPVPSQERQEACQEADCTHQARVQANANTTTDNADGLDGHRNDASLNVNASSVYGTNGEFRATAAAQHGVHVPTHIDIANAQIQYQNTNHAANEESKRVEFVDQGEVTPLAQHLSVNDNEQQEPVEDDEQATAKALKSDFSIEDAVCPRPVIFQVYLLTWNRLIPGKPCQQCHHTPLRKQAPQASLIEQLWIPPIRSCTRSQLLRSTLRVPQSVRRRILRTQLAIREQRLMHVDRLLGQKSR